MQFGQGTRLVEHRAQLERRYRGVGGAVLERERIGDGVDDVDGHLRLAGRLFGTARRYGSGSTATTFRDRRGAVPEVHPVAGASRTSSRFSAIPPPASRTRQTSTPSPDQQRARLAPGSRCYRLDKTPSMSVLLDGLPAPVPRLLGRSSGNQGDGPATVRS
jgi:hypothetical protein